MKNLGITAAALAGVFALSACATGEQALGGDSAGSSGDTIVIGSADFAENQLIAQIYSYALQDAGIDVREQFNIGSREVYVAALQDGSIDLIPEYSGALVKYLDPESSSSSSEDILAELDELMPDGLMRYEISEAQNKDVLAVTEETAEELGVTTISDLQPHAAELVLGGPPEWPTRVNGVLGLEQVYGLHFAEFVSLDAGGPLTTAALLNGQVDVGDLFSTDPAFEENGFVALEDDQNLFPAENVVPVIVEAKSNDTIESALNAVSAALTVDGLIEMNGRIADGESIQTVARDWLDQAAL